MVDNSMIKKLFTNILKTAHLEEWEEHDIARLVCCLLKSADISSNDIHSILNNSKSFIAPVLTAILESNITKSNIVLEWVLELQFNEMISILTKCGEEETFTVLPQYENNILVLLFKINITIILMMYDVGLNC